MISGSSPSEDAGLPLPVVLMLSPFLLASPIPTSTIGGVFAIPSETSMFFDAGIGSTSTTGCKVWLLFSRDCDVSLIRELMKYLLFWMVFVLGEWVDCLFLGKFYKTLNLKGHIAS